MRGAPPPMAGGGGRGARRLQGDVRPVRSVRRWRALGARRVWHGTARQGGAGPPGMGLAAGANGSGKGSGDGGFPSELWRECGRQRRSAGLRAEETFVWGRALADGAAPHGLLSRAVPGLPGTAVVIAVSSFPARPITRQCACCEAAVPRRCICTRYEA